MSTYEKIKMLCDKKKIAVTYLEKELGFGRGSIGKMKNGSTSAERLQKIANYFGVTVGFLIGSETSITDEFSELDSVYLSLAKEARDNEIDPEDIRMAIQMFKEMKERNQNRDKKR